MESEYTILQRAAAVCESHARLLEKMRADYLLDTPNATEQGYVALLMQDRQDFAREVLGELDELIAKRR